MTSPLDNVLHQALQIRLALQISLSNFKVVEEWMDIHLDRFLEHVPMPPEMPNGHAVSYLAGMGSDLKRMWWGAWGNPRGFVPKMADYFKLCNIAKSDEQILDQIGLAFEPELVGAWVGVWGGKVITGWHFWDPHEFAKLEPLFGTHEAKYLLKKWCTDHKIEKFQRFMQSIGEAPFSEIEFPVEGESWHDKVVVASEAFQQFTGAPLDPALTGTLEAAGAGGMAISVRIAGGKVTKLGVLCEGVDVGGVKDVCAAARVPAEERLERVVNTMSSAGVARIEYGRAGEHAGVDVFVEPTEPARKQAPGEAAKAPTSSTAN
jgi:hypothetical protein